MIYIDITQYINNRLNTGIQRVVNQYLRRALKSSSKIQILYCNTQKEFFVLNQDEVLAFLDDISNYEFKNFTNINLFENQNQNQKTQKIFFDIDSVWNAPYKRAKLYKKLKKANYKIYNFIYDLIPILFPHFLYKQTQENFKPYIKAIIKYSSKIFFDSNSAKNDFLKLKPTLTSKKSIAYNKQKTKVIYLGSDFKNKISKPSIKYNQLLKTKYILFVGTIEPRKQQNTLLEAYDSLIKKYPKQTKNLNLVYIGKIGWNVQEFIHKLNTHPKKDISIFHYQELKDQDLINFYKNAFLVCYLSHYEGYGLPIVESLNHNKITITSHNSSIPEVGKDYVEYIYNSSKQELIDKILLYIKNQKIYKRKKAYIKKNYKTNSWDNFYRKLQKNIIK